MSENAGKAERIIGLDLLRIVSVLGVIYAHISGQGGIAVNLKTGSLGYYVFIMVYTLARCSVNLFAMITGYVYATKRTFRSYNLLILLAETAFYCLFITLIGRLFLPGMFSSGIKSTIGYLFPSAIGKYWYITSYVFVFFMLPYIAAFVSNLEKRTFEKLLMLLFVLLSLIPSIGLYDYFRTDNGFSPWWLMYCCAIGMYLRLYGFPKFAVGREWLILALSMVIMVICRFLMRFLPGERIIHDALVAFCFPVYVIEPIALISMFSRFSVSNEKQKKMIKLLTAKVFVVYIGHTHPIIMNLIEGSFGFIGRMNPLLMLALSVGISVAIYIAVSLIDTVRCGLFRLLRIERAVGAIGNKLDRILQ